MVGHFSINVLAVAGFGVVPALFELLSRNPQPLHFLAVVDASDLGSCHFLQFLIYLHEIFALLGKGEDLQLYLPEFDLLPRLNPLTQHRCIVVLLMQLLHDIRLIDPIGPPEVPGVFGPGLEGEHVVELILGGPPKRAVDGKLQFFSPASPVVIKQGGKLLEGWLLHQLLVLAL